MQFEKKLHENSCIKIRLHTLSRSPYQTDIDAILRCIAPQDVLLLLQDGVIAAMAKGNTVARLFALSIPLYALRDDVEARGLITEIATDILLLDYTEFVQLTAKYAVQLAW